MAVAMKVNPGFSVPETRQTGMKITPLKDFGDESGTMSKLYVLAMRPLLYSMTLEISYILQTR
ncbi:hypothetical protein BPAE_0291g00030 [Botrytis paeoniae]|uniref:Uncharacterized protein n=1 Tax=Botrytis paeoniae TaxID=278948 RepID=A0A4Z1F6T5_9HELO|nr:hypothetical protein BPAE_0291g00030 [Botrytis paeoniae]